MILNILSPRNVVIYASLHFSYSVRSGQTRNVEAARVSMPGQVKKLVYLMMASSSQVLCSMVVCM